MTIHVGLTPQGEEIINKLHYHGTWQFVCPNGDVAQLRHFGQWRFPVTCSVGGWYSEIPQLFVRDNGHNLLFTALLDSTHEHMLDTTVDGKGFTHWTPIFAWDKDRRMYVLQRDVPLMYLSYTWTSASPSNGIWNDSDDVKVPPDYFDRNELKEGLVSKKGLVDAA